MAVKLNIEFKGGAELLFGGTRAFELSWPPPEVAAEGKADAGTLAALLRWLRDRRCQERPELFMTGDTVRPGILVLINDVDWELEGETAYALQDGDTIVFISTLHGG